MEHQDFLYLFQTCATLAALISIFLVFKYENFDNYVDNRKEALRVMLDIHKNPERALWIQNIGKGDNKQISFDEEILKLQIPSADEFIANIQYYRDHRREVLKQGRRDILLWIISASVYLLAHILNLYDYPWMQMLMILFFVPATHSFIFIKNNIS